jgi:hypothetical protein
MLRSSVASSEFQYGDHCRHSVPAVGAQACATAFELEVPFVFDLGRFPRVRDVLDYVARELLLVSFAPKASKSRYLATFEAK